jgi:hypothetical protein
VARKDIRIITTSNEGLGDECGMFRVIGHHPAIQDQIVSGNVGEQSSGAPG